MSHYLAQLKALLAEKPLSEKLTKLTEGTSVSSVSDQVRHISGEAAAETFDADAVEKRTDHAHDDVGPADWGERIEALRFVPCPDGFSPERWERLQQAAVQFAQQWAAQAMRLG